jgi:hypothetical protein
MTVDDDYRASACTGKIGFTSFLQAQRVGERSSRRGRSRQIYRCPHCHLFHLGRRPITKRRNRITIEEP